MAGTRDPMQVSIRARVLLNVTLLVTLGSRFDLLRTRCIMLGTRDTVPVEGWTMNEMLVLSGARLDLAMTYVTLISLLCLRLRLATL